MLACNGQDRGQCLSLKGRWLETGVSRRRREVYQWKCSIQRCLMARSALTGTFQC
jgi:hypothetical protein